MALPRITSLWGNYLWKGGSIVNVHQSARTIHTTNSLAVGLTSVLRAEPPKKLTRVDPNIEKSRKERHLKRLQKVQTKMGAPDLKPIEEFQTNPRIFTEDRKRPPPSLSFEEEERRALLKKHWACYKHEEFAEESRLIEVAKRSQQRALEELRAESEELYQKALEKDFWLFPLEIHGPTETPPIKGYKEQHSLDGQYVDKTKQYK